MELTANELSQSHPSLAGLSYVSLKFPSHSRMPSAISAELEGYRWLTDQLVALDLALGTVFVLEDRWGLLSATLMGSEARWRKMRAFFSDSAEAAIADTLNHLFLKQDWKFKASLGDWRNLRLPVHEHEVRRQDGSIARLAEAPDTILTPIFASAADVKEWWPRVPAGRTMVVRYRANFCAEELVTLEQVLFRGIHGDVSLLIGIR